MNVRFFRTYKSKTKKLFKRYIASRLTDRQCKKLFKSNLRYKMTFKQVLKSEYRLDTLVFRIFWLPNIEIARALVLKNYFLVNGKELSSPQMILKIGDFVEPTNKITWNFLYNNMLSTIASFKKYLERIFFKFNFPFVMKRRRFRLKEYGKYKDKTLNHLTRKIKNRITRRFLYFRYKKIKNTTTSKVKPPKRYLFKQPKEDIKQKRIKNYILKKVKSKNFVVKKRFHIKLHFKKLRFQFKLFSKLSVLQNKKFKIKLKRKRKYKKKRVSKLLFLIKKKKRKIKDKIKKFLVKKKKQRFKIRRFRKFQYKIFNLSKKRRVTRLRRIRKTRTSIFKMNTFIKKKHLLTIPLKKKKKGFRYLKKKFKKLIKRPIAQYSRIGLRTRIKIRRVILIKKKTKKMKLRNKFQNFGFFNLFLNRRSKIYFYNSAFFLIKEPKRKKRPYWRRFIPRQPNNLWQIKRITKKHVNIFRYLKKFNNKYKQFNNYHKLSQNLWIQKKYLWQKTNFIFEKKKKRLLVLNNISKKGFAFLKKSVKTLAFYKKMLSVKYSKNLKQIFRIKRKYLLLKGFYRKYKEYRIHVQFSNKSTLYNPIQIQYKKINLLFKHRPIVYYFIEINYNSLDFTVINDVDFLFFPYRTFLNFKALSFIL